MIPAPIRSIALIASALGLSAGLARADDQFDFSYTFSPNADQGAGTIVTGSFDGTASGDLITGIYDVSFAVDHVSATGTIYADGFAGINYDTAVDNAAVLSFDGLQNAFIFANSDPASAGFSDTFQFNAVTAASPPGSDFTFNFAIALSPGSGVSDENPFDVSSWSVTDLGPAPVPDSGTTASMTGLALVGLALFGSMLRRPLLAR